MKRYLFIFCVFVVCGMVFVSCDQKSQSTPLLHSSSLLIRTTPDGARDTIRVTDSLSIGDTLRLNMVLDGYLNTLTSFAVRTDTSSIGIALEIDSIVNQYLIAGSDPANGRLNFAAEQLYVCPATLRFVPRRSGTHLMEFILANDADASYSPRTYTYKPVVR